MAASSVQRSSRRRGGEEGNGRDFETETKTIEKRFWEAKRIWPWEVVFLKGFCFGFVALPFFGKKVQESSSFPVFFSLKAREGGESFLAVWVLVGIFLRVIVAACF